MADDEFDQLYRADPADFTALRTKLSAAAKQRGDAELAKRISAARKPTTSASIVNRLVLNDPQVAQRLADLGVRLRTAHAEMDGERIRELSAEQRRLIEEFTRTALRAAGVSSASARDDVTDTLQAAVADPDVAARLGRLTKAEQWSGFGEFGDTTAVLTTTRKRKPAAQPAAAEPDHRKADAEREQARTALAAAERAKADADRALSERQSDLAAARLRLDDARNRLTRAETELAEVEGIYEAAKQVSRDAADLVKEAKTRVAGARRAPQSRTRGGLADK